MPENIILSENAKKFGLLQKEPKSDDGDEEGGGLGMSTLLTTLADDLVGTGQSLYIHTMGNPTTIGNLSNLFANTDWLRSE